jgi:hypothetical protein
VWLCLKSSLPFLIHTWLQPGDWQLAADLKPFKRFPVDFRILPTWLKPGVNETEQDVSRDRTCLRQSRQVLDFTCTLGVVFYNRVPGEAS